MEMTLVPAFADYTSEKEVKQAFNEGKDFLIVGMHPYAGKYCNRQDLLHHKEGEEIKIRFNKKQDFVYLKVE